ncbi:MAG: biopolymer transporter Tol [Candidatus Kapabacteria bacterium]|nr:biopolymer transporter Tol [Candidatus Kapabacteria bacterium]
MGKHTFVIAALLVAVLAASAHDASAQQFGKNKLQYRAFTWKYIQTDHFDIYYYDDAGLNLAKFTANVSEHALAEIQEHWRYRINARVAIILYNSKNDFQQTNVISEYLPEGVGGVTELFKNRVVVPFEGDWEKFRHVIHHELVHAVLNDKFYGGSIQDIISNRIQFMLPIWMNEGLAEFESQGGYDIETDMFIRDAVIGNYLPDLQELNGYFAYRGGQTFYWYVEKNYGREKIAELLNNCKSTGNLDEAFRRAFGKSLEEFNEQWKHDLKKQYWPDIADRKRPVDFANKLTNHKKEESFFNTSPSISPDGRRFAFISDRDGFRSVYVADIDKPEKAEQVFEGENDVNFEELHLLTPSIAWSPDSRSISLSVKSRGKDAIFIFDLKTGDDRKIEFDMDAIYSVAWSPDGQHLAFQGIKGDQSDIYLYTLKSRDLVNITDDIYSDHDPQWSHDNRTIYFISDRRDNPVGTANRRNTLIWNYNYHSSDIYSIQIDGRNLMQITNTPTITEKSPTPGSGGNLLYISDQNGINNIYLRDSSGATRVLTNSISGIDQLAISSDDSKLVFNAWNDDGYDIFLLRLPFSLRYETDTLPQTKFLSEAPVASANSSAATDTLSPESSVTPVTSVDGYGSVSIDPSDAVASLPPSSSAAGVPVAFSTTVDSRVDSGDFTSKDYKVKFSSDVVQATGTYDPFYGAQGMLQMLFSDVLGDHQIYAATNLQMDLKNSDFVVNYLYLPNRMDYGVGIFQNSTFGYLPGVDANYYLTRFRQLGLQSQAAYPFDRFTRLDMGISLSYIGRESMEIGNPQPDEGKLMFIPSFGYVFDNSSPWFFAPNKGSRYNITAQGSPKLGNAGVGFYSLLGDFRHYIPFDRDGFASLALRFAGGASFGPNPQKFFLGGQEGWLNYEFSSRGTFENPEDFFFFTPGYPMRGFNFSEAVGSKYGLANAELRFPLLQALVGGAIPLYLQGNIFADIGAAWNSSLNLTQQDASGNTITDDLLIGTGFGFRTYLFGLPARLDIAWSYTLESWSPPKYYLSLGYDF